jgi:dihydroxy-acid dehydratase
MIGVASTWSEITPCNIHINKLAESAKAGAKAAGGAPQIFNTITVSDGISMGTPGMRYSLPSREIIADSIETVVGAQRMDGFVAIGGCDKNMPGLPHGHGADERARGVCLRGHDSSWKI